MRAWVALVAVGLGGCVLFDHRESDVASGGSDATSSVGGDGSVGGMSTVATGGANGGNGGNGGEGASGGDPPCANFDDIEGLCLIGRVDVSAGEYVADAMALSNEAIYVTARDATGVNQNAEGVTVFRVDRSHLPGSPLPIEIIYTRESLVPAIPLLRTTLGMRPSDDKPLISVLGAPWYQPVGLLGRDQVGLPASASAFAFGLDGVYAAVNASPTLVWHNGAFLQQPTSETFPWQIQWVGVRSAPSAAIALGIRERADAANGAVCGLILPAAPLTLDFATHCTPLPGRGMAFDWNADAVFARTLSDNDIARLLRLVPNISPPAIDTNAVGPIAATNNRLWFADGAIHGGIPRVLRCATPLLQSCADITQISSMKIQRISAIAIEPAVVNAAVFFLADIDEGVGTRVALFRFRRP